MASADRLSSATIAAILDSDPAYWQNPNKFRKKILEVVWSNVRKRGTPFLGVPSDTPVDRWGERVYGLNGNQLRGIHAVRRELSNLLILNAALEGKGQEDGRRVIASLADQRVDVIVHSSHVRQERRHILDNVFNRFRKVGADVPDYGHATKYMRSLEGRILRRRKRERVDYREKQRVRRAKFQRTEPSG